MHPLTKENRDEQIFSGLAAGRPGDRASHHLSHIQLANRGYATYVNRAPSYPRRAGSPSRKGRRFSAYGGACRPKGDAQFVIFREGPLVEKLQTFIFALADERAS